jgi:hypothetical protein
MIAPVRKEISCLPLTSAQCPATAAPGYCDQEGTISQQRCDDPFSRHKTQASSPCALLVPFL